MTRFVLAVVFCALLAGAMPAGAQSPAPASTPPTAYNDPAMSFTPPSDFKWAGGAPFDPESNQPSIVATFVKHYRQQDMHVIQIAVESAEGTNLSSYETLASNELRGQTDSVFISHKQQTTLSNGMPAIFEEVSTGEGFTEMKRWQYLWVDGMRGVILSDTGRYGEITEEQAKAELANASAVAYPRNRI